MGCHWQWSLSFLHGTGTLRYLHCRNKWRLTDTDLCPCGETQMMSYIVESCPVTKLNGGLSRLQSADEDAVSWLTNYGSWHAYEKKNTSIHTFNLRRPQQTMQSTDFGLQCLNALYEVISDLTAATAAIHDHCLRVTWRRRSWHWLVQLLLQQPALT